MSKSVVVGLCLWICFALSVSSCLLAAPAPTVSASPSQTPRPASPMPRPTQTLAPTSTSEPSPPAVRGTSTPTLFPELDLYTVSDETGAIVASIPVVWTDQRTLPWLDAAGKTIGTTFIASTDIDGFLNWQVEGVSISVSRRLDRGYIQLLDEEYDVYSELCTDPFLDRWDFVNDFHRGKYYALVDCGGVEDGWLRLFSVVGRTSPTDYTARVLAYDMIPIFGSDFGDILMMFQVFPEKLP